MVAEITEDLSAGPIDRFNEGLEKVDKLVKDIYGGDYDRFHLSGDTGEQFYIFYSIIIL